MRELRIYGAPGGKKQLRDEYYALLSEAAARADEREKSGLSEYDMRRKLQGLGAPYEAVKVQEALRDTPALEAARKFNQDPRAAFLLMVGDRGLGKTAAAVHVLAEFCRKFPWNSQASGALQLEPAMFCPASRLTRISNFGHADQDLLERLNRAAMVVVDDVGDEATEIGKTTLVDLLINRHAKKRRTVITSNLRGEAFKKRYGEALADRIRSSGYVREFTGKSMRPRLEAR